MQVDTPRMLYDRPTHRFVAEFIGESSFLEVSASDGAWCWNGRPLQLGPEPSGSLGPPPTQGVRACVMLRPERLRMAPAGQDSPPPGTNVLPARVGDVIYQGDTFLVQAVLDDGTRVSVRAIAGTAALARAPARGEAVELHFDAGDAVLLPQGGPV
jgi:putative spermidine/putrescine transport system ATP-binding protein